MCNAILRVAEFPSESARSQTRCIAAGQSHTAISMIKAISCHSESSLNPRGDLQNSKQPIQNRNISIEFIGDCVLPIVSTSEVERWTRLPRAFATPSVDAAAPIFRSLARRYGTGVRRLQWHPETSHPSDRPTPDVIALRASSRPDLGREAPRHTPTNLST